MYIVVVGCGKVGYYLTRALLAMGHETLVIEKDSHRCDSLRDELGSVALQGDGTEFRVLEEAGAARADVVIAVATRDEDNLATCQLAKHLFNTPRVMALVKDPQNEALFKLLGVDVTINSTHLVLSTIEEEIPGHALVHLVNLRTLDKEMISVNIPSDAAVVGKPLSDIELPPNSFISLVVKTQTAVLPSQDLILDSGDDVVCRHKYCGGTGPLRDAYRGGLMGKSIAYLGPVGTFSEEAALLYDPQGKLEPFPSIPAVALAVASGTVEEGIVPIENSLEGSVTHTLDILILEARLFIRREIVLPIEHCLLVEPGIRAADIQTVYSHPQALGQCRDYLELCFPKAQLIASLSTVAAVVDMKESSAPAAAISPKRAAQMHGVDILAQGIQDNASNATRFVVLANADHPPTGRDKTSLCFSFREDKPGLLYSVMGEFARRNINLAKVESRPTKQSLGEYIFLIDCEGHREDTLVKEVIEAVTGQTSTLRIFGSYPRWTEQGG